MIAKPPGVEDIFPDRIAQWNHIVNTARQAFREFNFREIIVPIMEYTEVFSRGIGDETDIVSKEMFTFEDRGGRSLTLRPEGTASVVRAYVENGDYNRLATCKLCYAGPMFRAERPQKGRLRQFNQFGAELFGELNPWYDFEIIALMNTISQRLGIGDYQLLINSIGCPECRPAYLAALTAYYSGKAAQLCEDCAKRLHKNPLRLLDCKNAQCRSLKVAAPSIAEHRCAGCRVYHAELTGLLQDGGIAYTEDPFLVRGLDYYTKTTFEFVTEKLGGQNAFAAGGRYDGLVEVFGGKPTPAIGFAAGIERIFLMLDDDARREERLDVFVAYSGDAARQKALRLVSTLRAAHISADIDPGSKGFKAQFKKADREKSLFTAIIGDSEAAEHCITLKDMASGQERRIADDAVIDAVRQSIVRSGL